MKRALMFSLFLFPSVVFGADIAPSKPVGSYMTSQCCDGFPNRPIGNTNSVVTGGALRGSSASVSSMSSATGTSGMGSNDRGGCCGRL